MAVTNIADLQTRANQIANETTASANTATRVGSLNRDMTDTLNALITAAQTVANTANGNANEALELASDAVSFLNREKNIILSESITNTLESDFTNTLKYQFRLIEGTADDIIDFLGRAPEKGALGYVFISNLKTNSVTINFKNTFNTWDTDELLDVNMQSVDNQIVLESMQTVEIGMLSYNDYVVITSIIIDIKEYV